jgi:hypothetical protein
VKATFPFLAALLLVPAMKAQEKKPWKVDRLCGRVEYVQKIPDRKRANIFSEKRRALKNLPVTLFERPKNVLCCESSDAVETVKTGRGGHFEFKTRKTGDFWLTMNWNGKGYKLPLIYNQQKNSPTICSEQGLALDDNGSVDWWVTITVD